MHRLHEQVLLAVDGLLAQAEGVVLHDGAHTGGGEHAAQTGAVGADHLSQRALGDQDDLQSALLHGLSGDLGVEAHVGGDELLDLMVVDQLGYAVVVLTHGAAGHGGVVADHSQVLHAALGQGIDELVSIATAHEAAEHNSGAVGDQLDRLFDRNELRHCKSLL